MLMLRNIFFYYRLLVLHDEIFMLQTNFYGLHKFSVTQIINAYVAKKIFNFLDNWYYLNEWMSMLQRKVFDLFRIIVK